MLSDADYPFATSASTLAASGRATSRIKRPSPSPPPASTTRHAASLEDAQRSMSPPSSSQLPRTAPEPMVAGPSRRARRTAPYPSPERSISLDGIAVGNDSIAGPSRIPARASTRAARAVKATAKANPKPIDVDEDDEPVFVGQSMAKRLSEKFVFKGRGGSGSSSPAPSLGGDDDARPLPPSNGRIEQAEPGGSIKPEPPKSRGRPKGKGKALVKLDDDEDEVVHGSSDDVEVVGVVEKRKPGRPRKVATAGKATSTKGKGKAPARGRSASTATGATPPPPPLQLMPYRDPLPVPSWLGKPAVLLPLVTCPLCGVKWGKSDHGVKRWKHISTCLPPSHKPSDPPLDLQAIINTALISLSGPRPSYSLLDIHIDSPDVRDNRVDVPSAPQANQDQHAQRQAEAKNALPPIPRNMRPVGLKSVTYVRPADVLGEEEWDVVIEGRLRGVIGRSPPPLLFPDLSADSAADCAGEPVDPQDWKDEEAMEIPTTQPIGPSVLAEQYSRTSLQSGSDADDTTMVDDEVVEASHPRDEQAAGNGDESSQSEQAANIQETGQQLVPISLASSPSQADIDHQHPPLPLSEVVNGSRAASRPVSPTNSQTNSQASAQDPFDMPTSSQKRTARPRGRFIIPGSSSATPAAKETEVSSVTPTKRQGEVCALEEASPDMISAHRLGDDDQSGPEQGSDAGHMVAYGIEPREESAGRALIPQAGQEAPAIVSRDSGISISSSSSGMSLDPPIQLRDDEGVSSSERSVRGIELGQGFSAASPKSGVVPATGSSPFRLSASLSEYRSPAKSPASSPFSATPSHLATPPNRRQLVTRGRLAGSSSISPDTSAELGGTVSPASGPRAEGDSSGRWRVMDGVTPTHPRMMGSERMSDPSAPYTDPASPLGVMAGVNQSEVQDDAGHDDVGDQGQPDEWEWGNDAVLDWHGDEADGSFLHYEPDPVAGPAGHVEKGDSGTDTDIDEPLAVGIQSRRHTRSSLLRQVSDSPASKIPKKRTLIDLTGSSGEIVSAAHSVDGPASTAAHVSPTHPVSRQNRAESLMFTDTDASSVAPEDAGLDPDHLHDDDGDEPDTFGYGHEYEYDGGVDEWADWGNDAYLIFSADENAGMGNMDENDGGVWSHDAAERTLGAADGDGSDAEEDEDGDTTLTTATAMYADAITPTSTKTRRHWSKRTTLTPPVPFSGKGKGNESDKETREESQARGMPDYDTWELKRLQRLCTGYGYRPSTKHSALVDIAVKCWRALNPRPVLGESSLSPLASKKGSRRKATATTARKTVSRDKGKGSVRVPSGRRVRDGSDDDDVDNEEEEVEDGDPREFVDIDGDDSDISSADVPLAKTKTKTRSTGAHAPNSRSAKAGPSQSRTKGKSSSKPTSEISDIESIASSATGIIDDRPMDERFRGMVKNDSELYLRILYYEPIHFDEFVSKAIRAGFKDRRDKGWKIALKKFLDFEGITFYTEDPTGGSRRRH